MGFVGNHKIRQNSVIVDDPERRSEVNFQMHLELYNLGYKIRNDLVGIFLFITYLVLPSVTVVIFRMFPCQNVDPSNGNSPDNYYLIADYSISCNSDRYRYGVAWAIFMIFIYPIGLPILYFCLLYNIRKELIDHKDEK